jgi:hypothetical protein
LVSELKRNVAYKFLALLADEMGAFIGGLKEKEGGGEDS